MPNITLPDGSIREFDQPVSGFDIVNTIGPGLAKAAVAMTVNDEQKDLSTTITEDASVSILTGKDEQGLDVIRHTLAAQILARAIKDLYPDAKLAIGPTIETGFYYDVEFVEPLVPDDLPKIESRMREIIKEGLPVTREMWDRTDAIAYFENKGESYKAEIIRDAPPEDTQVSLYRQGEGETDTFMDLCFGPHLPSLKKAVESFTLTNLAGAYWRGDSQNQQLTRIYGVAFADKKALKAHLHMLEEAKKRDHRLIGKQLGLFHLQESAPGMIFWHPKGWQLWQVVEQHMREVYQQTGYGEVRCPQILDVTLWKESGHWDNYQDNMFFTESEKRTYALKPMNCPGHVQVFNQGLHSYRELPIRYGEFGSCHRNEASGALHGIMRVRGFTQDDGHIFCTEAQLEDEVAAFHQQAMQVYQDFGFDITNTEKLQIKVALRPEARMGDEATWDKAEDALRSALRNAGVESWEELPGEGAFYGPKIEYHLSDAIGRSWQLGTMQVDFMMPERLGAEYVDENSQRKHPVMLHRAIVGSLERFIGILIENFAGNFPLWLAPTQAVVIGITNQQDDAVLDLAARLKKAGIRAISDISNAKVSYKVREYAKEKIPLTLVIGNQEIEDGTVSLRRFGSKDSETLSVEDFIEQTLSTIAQKQ